MSAQTVAPRFVGVLGVAFVLGSIIGARSLDEAIQYRTAASTRDNEAKVADKTIWDVARTTTQNVLPEKVQPIADNMRKGWVEHAVRRRPMLEALAVTNCAVGILLAVFAASAMRLRASGRSWLIQTALAAMAFTIVQIVLQSIINIERFAIVGPYFRAVKLIPNLPGFEFMSAVIPVLMGGAKIAFLIYLVVVLRRPAVRAMYRAEPR